MSAAAANTTQTLEEQVAGVKTRMVAFCTKTVAETDAPYATAGDATIDFAKVERAVEICRASPVPDAMLAALKDGLKAFTEELYNKRATSLGEDSDVWVCACCGLGCPMDGKYSVDHDCKVCNRRVCRDCAAVKGDYDQDEGNFPCICGICHAFGHEDEETPEAYFNRKYPHAKCHRCEVAVNGRTVVYCGGAGGACETWFCADCHADGTDDCSCCHDA